MNGFVDPRAVLKRYGLRPKHSWGQNFLISAKAVEVIARRCVDEPDRHVIEIGAGPGTLTRSLLAHGARVTAIERERDMCQVLTAEFSNMPGFSLIEADAGSFDFGEHLAQEPAVVAGNLPYQITGRILRRVLEAPVPPLLAVLMVQMEVAERIVAQPGSRSRGALSVIVDARCRTRIALRLAQSAFSPRPKVRSAVVELIPRKSPRHAGVSATEFDAAVKAAFSARRKTVRNALLNSGWIAVSDVDQTLREAGIDPQMRAERLETDDFAALARAGAVHRIVQQSKERVK